MGWNAVITYQIIWLLAQGKRSHEVAQITGYSRSWIYELVWGYNRLGADALDDKRHQNPGAKPLLNDLQQAQLWQLLQQSPADGDLWDGPKVAAWMSETLEQPIHPQRGWENLRALEMRRLVNVQNMRKQIRLSNNSGKKMAQTVEQVRALYPDATVEVCAEDEHRIGLHPVRRKFPTPVLSRTTAPEDVLLL